VHPTQPVEIFGNVSSLSKPFGIGLHWPPVELTFTENFTDIVPG